MTLPEAFVEQIKGYSAPELDGLLEALDAPASVSVRVNRRKMPEYYAEKLVPWCQEGVYLVERPKFTFDPLMHQGAYYVQDASSMIISHIVSALTSDGIPCRYLDACAAPGGKTGAAADALPPQSVIVANEYVKSRASVLRENMAKWGNPYVSVVSGDTSMFSKHRGIFDIIAADVPCSGEGMMRKDPEAVRQWSRALVEQCVARQRMIIDNLWPSLRSGGYFIYSTCTFNRDENEEMVGYMIERYGCEPVAVSMSADWGVCGGIGVDYPCYRFLPGRVRGEGLFVAVMRKTGGDELSNAAKRASRKSASKAAAVPPEISVAVNLPSGFKLEAEGENVWARYAESGLPDEFAPKTLVGTLRGRTAVPSQELALSAMLRRGIYPECEVDRMTALRYLRREALDLGEHASRGIVLLTYNGLPLGFVKNLGNRANNLYPAEWKILSSPDESSLGLMPFDKNH